MIAASLVKRSASRPRSRIIRALCPFTTPLVTNFLLVPGRAAHYIQDPSDTQSFSAKKTSITGAFGYFVAIGNWQPGAAKIPSCH